MTRRSTLNTMPDQIHGISLDQADATELVETLAFLGDWLRGRDHELLAASLRRFVSVDGYDLEALQSDLARFAFLLGDDGARLFAPDGQ